MTSAGVGPDGEPVDTDQREEGPVAMPEDREVPAGPASSAAPARSARRLGRYGIVGIVFLLVGAGGLLADYTLPWSSDTAERDRPLVGVVNEGAPWIDRDRADLVEAYASSSFYTQSNVIFTWLAWTVTIVAGAALLLTEALGRFPRTRDTTRALAATGVILAATMMLITVSRRIGRLYIDRNYNEIQFYTYKGAIWTQGIGALVVIVLAAYLLWYLRRTHPPLGGQGVRRPHYNALPFCVLTIALVAGVMLVAPWFPLAQFHLPDIVGDQWWGEGAMYNLAEASGDRGLAGQGYVGAMRALYVTAGTAALSAFGVVAWQRTRSRVKARVWGLLAQAHLLAIVPLHLGLSGYGIYVQSMHRIDRLELLSNQFVGQAILILLVTWVAFVMWILVPYLKRWPRAAPAGLPLEENEGRDSGDVVASD